ncbi:hypothetical protein CDQ84_02765 [Clostridium thermosuccinogenes]|uniref:HAMP domain-containing protein n=2 Tax=Clostridium thermosuccinogenes TaxID=84032 RepID=A0A2K2FQK6_9CLOT|nr:sensor histidine kinase [Pseudoclostridium thermosuccinogenes]AUS95992.1 hypothetical protein CDO33_05790 [Pseudoclostridium thermosuccinogenes]PNT99381.1 hypothetical protein CDQ85_02765 [Pseudoclostridium thermosuccinogenes]PNU01068.1 hypothetical protein CDQ84_02765 [Pseudoclostridium thermosuccinogenes]
MIMRFYTFIRNVIVNTRYSVKMIFFVIFFSALPLFTISTLLGHKMGQIIENELSQSYEQTLNQYISNINYKVDIYQTLLTNIASNSTIGEQLSYDDDTSPDDSYDTALKVSKELGMLIGSRKISELYNFMIYSYNTKNLIYGPRVSNISAIKDEKWYMEMKERGKVNDYFIYKTGNGKKEILSFTKEIVNLKGERYGEKVGFVKLDVYAQSFFSSIANFENKESMKIYILDEAGNVIYNESNEKLPLLEDQISKLYQSVSGLERAVVPGGKVMLVHRNISAYGWKALFIFHYGEIDKKASDINKTIITFLLLASIGILILAIMFSKKFSARMKTLLNKMEKVEEGDMEITEEIEGKDEIGIIDTHFNKMVRKVQYLINNNYVNQLEKREAELNALQFQINPHFLYNTLESINSIAAMNKCFEICEISQKLGEMFRYSINNGRSEMIPLEEELKHIANYIYIQKIRFQDKFEVFYNIEESAKSIRVLKFILQPIIENAIVHGFKDKTETGYIEVSAYIEKNKLFIKVEDDGNGMTEDKVEALNDYINKKDDNITKAYRKSIGIRNVNMRIKLACGDEYGIKISSDPGSGTKVLYTLPIYGLEEEI